MHKKAEELMFADLLQFREDGKINLFSNPAFLFPTEYIHKLEEKMEPEQIYSLAKKIPEPIIQILNDRKMKDLEKLDFLLELAEVLGLGNIQIQNFTPQNKEHQITINNAVTNRVSCHHTRGYLATVFSDALKKKFECKETTCMSKGGEACTFVIAP